MRKNIANQKLACQLISKTDGSDVTAGTTTVYVTIDAGAQTSVGTATHEGNGCWTIDTGVSGNTNGAHLAFTWVNTSACSVTQNVYPTGFDIGAANIAADIQTIKAQAVTCGAGVTVLASLGTAATSTAQTGDTYALANGATGFAAIDTVVDTISGKIIGTLATGTHNPQSGDSYAIVNGAAGLVAIDTVVDAIKVKTDFLPSITPGAANGLFIAGTNAATVVTTSFTTSFIGNLSGSVASVGSGVSLAASQHVIVDSGTVTTLTNLPPAPTNWLMGTGVDATAVTKIQAGLATPTNITAGTITTVTNLTNAPTAGDLTATMKASVNAEVDTALNTAIPGSPVAGSINDLIMDVDNEVDAVYHATILVDTTIAAANRSTTTCELVSGSDQNDAYVGMLILLDSDEGALVYVSRVITAYNGATRLVTWGLPLIHDPVNGGRAVVIPGNPKIITIDTNTAATQTLAAGATGFSAIDTAVDAIKVKTDYLPSVVAGGAGGVFIAGSNAATSINTALTANITGNLSGSVSSVAGAVGSVSAAVTVGTNNDKTGYSLAVAPPTAVEIVTAIDTTSTSVATIDANVDAVLLAVGTLASTSGRIEAIMPTEIIKSPSGDKYVECFLQLYDASRLPFTAHDMDGGNYSTTASYNPLERVKPTVNNAGAYYFQIGATVSGSPATTPDWSTAQTPAQTCVDGDGNTWTNIGAAEPSTTALKNGMGVTCADEAGAGWELYSDNIGTPLLRVNECHHWDQTNRPQILTWVATGLYSFWMNADDAEADRTIYLTSGWFDKSRFEAGYSSTTDHRRVVLQTRIASAPTLTLLEIEGSTVLAKEATVAALPGADLMASVVGTVVADLV